MAEEKRVVQLHDGTAQPVYPVVLFENVCDSVTTAGETTIIPNALKSAARKKTSEFLGLGTIPVFGDNEDIKLIKKFTITEGANETTPATLSLETISLGKGVEELLKKEATAGVANKVLTKGIINSLRAVLPPRNQDWGTANFPHTGDNASAGMYNFYEAMYRLLTEKYTKDLKERSHNGAKVGEVLIDGGHKTSSPNDSIALSPSKPLNRTFGNPFASFVMDNGVLLQDVNEERNYAVTDITINRGIITVTRGKMAAGGAGLDLPSLISTLTAEMNKTTGRANGFDGMLDKFYAENNKRLSTSYVKAPNMPIRVKDMATGVVSTSGTAKGPGDTFDVLSDLSINADGHISIQKTSVSIPSAAGGGSANGAVLLNKEEKQVTNKPIYIDGTSAENKVALKIEGKATSSEGFFEVSDIRLKDIESEMTLEEVMEVIDKIGRPIRYKLKGSEDAPTQVGFVAQDVQKVLPEVVSTQIIDGEERLMVDYSRLSVVLFTALKHQNTLLYSLSNRIDKLEKKYATQDEQ